MDICKACTDAAGNVGNMSVTEGATTNTAKGVPVISATAPANFVADGDLKEWSSIKPITVSKKAGTSHLTDGCGYILDGDADFSWDTYLAVDNANLYVAFDVADDCLYEDATNDLVNSYMYDGLDLFLGLYDQRGESHGLLQNPAG